MIIIKNIFKLKIDSERIYGLDILRSIAILFVVIAHGSLLLPKKIREMHHFLNFDGVSIFFVLSGFLIGGILIKIIDEKGIDRKILINFWIKRWFRTLPNYYLILIILLMLNFLFTENFSVIIYNKYFIFCQNLFTNQPLVFFPEAWSLCVEEWFYLITPILIFILILIFGKAQRSVIIAAVIIIFSVTFFRYYRFENTQINSFSDLDSLFHMQVFTRLDSLMYGVIGAYIHFYHFDIWIKHKGRLVVMGICLFLMSKYLYTIVQINWFYSAVFSYSVCSVATLMLLPYLSQLKSGKGILYKIITYISLVSYSIYLLNYSIIQVWIINKIDWHWIYDNDHFIIIGKYGFYWFLVVSLSILLYKYFEIPMTNLRRKFEL